MTAEEYKEYKKRVLKSINEAAKEMEQCYEEAKKAANNEDLVKSKSSADTFRKQQDRALKAAENWRKHIENLYDVLNSMNPD